MHLPKLYCSVIQGKWSRLEPVAPIYNQTYSFWKAFWTDWTQATEGAQNTNYAHVDKFIKHDVHVVVHGSNQDVIGMVACSIMNLATLPTFDLPYLRDYPTEFVESMRSDGRGLAMTGEYLCVHPEYRKGTTGISLADILVGLKMEVFKALNASYCLGTGLRKVKMPEVCLRYGYREVGSLLKCNLECAALVNLPNTVVPHPDPVVAELVATLWNTRMDFTQSIFLPQPKTESKAA